MTTVSDMLVRLAEVDQQRRELLEAMLDMGFRARSLVGEYGEMIAAAHYGVARAGPSEPGYDLVAPRVGMVQVKTLRDAPSYRRSSMGAMTEPFDTLFALRLDINYRPTTAIEVPRPVLERVYPHGARASWTRTLGRQDGVLHIGETELRAAAEAVDTAAKRERDRRSHDIGFQVVTMSAELALRIARVEPASPRSEQIAQIKSQWTSGTMSSEAVRVLIDAGWEELSPHVDEDA